MTNSNSAASQNSATPRSRRQLSPRAIATRSMTAALRLPDGSEAQREAIHAHFQMVGGAKRVCPMRRR